jgi:AcrR family transcriptional regulator
LTTDRPRRRERLSPEVRREQLLTVAARILASDGLTGVSMDRVAREARVSKGLVYNYFRDCHALLCGLLRRELHAIWRKQVEATRGDPTFDGLVRSTTRVYLRHVAEHGELLRPLLAEPSIAADVAKERAPKRPTIVREFAERMSREYGVPIRSALAACDLLLDLSPAASRRMMETGESPQYLEELIVGLVAGAASALAHGVRPKAARKPATPHKRRAARRPVAPARLPRGRS